MALQFEARKVALKQDRTGYVLTLSLHPDEIPDELLRDFVGSRYACAVVRINDDESPAVYENRTQKAAILCKTELFQRFLGCKTEDGAAETLCASLGIGSRYACAVVRINDDESPVVYNSRVQKAAMLCKDPPFMKWMNCIDETDTTNSLCFDCGIKSRTELHGNKEAQAKFDQLLKDYEDANDPFA